MTNRIEHKVYEMGGRHHAGNRKHVMSMRNQDRILVFHQSVIASEEFFSLVASNFMVSDMFDERTTVNQVEACKPQIHYLMGSFPVLGHRQ